MTITRATAQTNSDTIKNETTAGANTATRVGQLFRDLSDSVAFTVDLAAAVAAGITEAAVRTALAALTADPDFNGKHLANLADPASAQQAATKNSSEAVVTAARVLTALAAAAGSIAVNTQKITGVVDPAAAQDAATKNYTDTADALSILKAGTRAFTGPQSMGSNKLTSLANGTATADAAAFGQLTRIIQWTGSTTVGNSAGGNRFLLNNTATTAGAAIDATEASPSRQQYAGIAGLLTRIDFTLDVALAAADLTITVRVNGADTALTCTLAHGSTTTSGTGSIVVGILDLVSIKVVASAADATTSNPRAIVRHNPA